MGEIEDLRAAIKKLHGCDAVYVRSENVLERFQGKTVWEGVVEVFDLVGHPKAKRCYAWSHVHGEKDDQRRFVAVLELLPVDSAKKAVQAAIVEQAKDRQSS